MDDKIYRGPGHPVGAHFHSGPPGKQGLPGVSPKVDMAYNEEEGTVVFTVTDGYGQRNIPVPMAELMDDWMEHDSYEVLKQWMDTHSDAEWWVDENNGLHLSNVPPDADDRIVDAVEDWLDDHPEATTTVEDGSITESKLNSALSQAINYKTAYDKLYGSGDSATANITRNADAEAPVETTSVENIVSYGAFDNVLSMIVGYDEYNNASSSGEYVSVSSVSDTSCTLSDASAVEVGMYITLHDSTPTKSNWLYVGKATAVSGNVVSVSAWYSYATGLTETPTNVSYAWVNPLTKLYGQNISLHATRNDRIAVIVGSQADLYSGNSGASVVGYSPVLRNGNGSAAFRVRSGNYRWKNAFINEDSQPTQALLKNVDTIVIQGDNKLGYFGLASDSVEDAEIPVHVVSADATLSEEYQTGTVKLFYNNTSSPVTLSSSSVAFKVRGTNRTSYCLPPNTMQAFFFVSATICVPIALNASNFDWNATNNWNGDIVAITTDTNLTTALQAQGDSHTIRKIDFYTGGSPVTLTITTGSMYINGDTTANVKTATIPPRVTGTIICAVSNNTFYIRY